LNNLENAYRIVTTQQIPKGELDELETFVGKKQNKLWIWTVVDHFQPNSVG